MVETNYRLRIVLEEFQSGVAQQQVVFVGLQSRGVAEMLFNHAKEYAEADFDNWIAARKKPVPSRPDRKELSDRRD